MTLGAPLLLGSLYGFIIGCIGVIVVAGRILGEENMLVNELEGYKEYKKKVKYRPVPFVW
jgi:protein-S-isoprenylcysteine O-methyltransferase Ste14